MSDDWGTMPGERDGPTGGMDEWLWSRYRQLEAVYIRMVDALLKMERAGVPAEHGRADLTILADDVRKMRDDAKVEYEAF